MPMIRKRSIEMTRVFNASRRNAWPRGDCATRRKFAAHLPRLRAQLSCPLHAIGRVVRAKVGIFSFVSGVGTFFGVREEYLALKGSKAVTRCRDKLVVSSRRGLFDNSVWKNILKVGRWKEPARISKYRNPSVLIWPIISGRTRS